MNYLLDTNVVSEWVKPRPDIGVQKWLAGADEDRIFLSVITLTELRHGVERLPVGARKKKLETWLSEDLPVRFQGRLLPVDALIADTCGRLSHRLIGRGDAAGRPLGAMDCLIAATSECHALTLVTRNVSDFERLGLKLLNPWT